MGTEQHQYTQQAQDAAEQPLFLVGAERSGSTMMKAMLNSHSQLAWLGQFEYATVYLPADGSWPALEDYLAHAGTDRLFQAHRFTVDEHLSYPALMHSFLQQYRQRTGKPRAGATVHLKFYRLPDIWPDARYIYLLRDGRDVARSCIRMGWNGNLWTGAERWLEAEREWERLRQRVPAERLLEIRYEELVAEPVEVLSRLCRFAGLEYDPAMLEYDRHSFYEKPDPRLANQWRRKLSSYQVRLAEARMGDRLRLRGYELSGQPPLNVSRTHLLWLKAHDKAMRSWARTQRLGWGLTLADFATRRLGLKTLNRSVQQRINLVYYRLVNRITD